MGDGIGICFLTNFGNFWDFEDKEFLRFWGQRFPDFRIFKKILKTFPENYCKIFLSKKIRENKIAAKFLLRFAYLLILSMTKKAFWGWLIRRNFTGNLVAILELPYFYLSLLWLSFMMAYFIYLNVLLQQNQKNGVSGCKNSFYVNIFRLL